MAPEGKLQIKSVDHIGIVVRDVDEAVKRYSKELGIGPWTTITLGPGVPHQIYGKEISSISVKIAQVQIGPLSLALVQPLSGPSIHQEFLDTHGEGIHHIGALVQNIKQASEKMHELGYPETTSLTGIGPKGDGAAVYFDTQAQLGALIELIQPPSE